MSTWHIACAADGDYVPHSAAMLHSVLACGSGHDVAIHYLHGPRLGGDSRRRLEEMVSRDGGSIEFLEVPDRWVVDLPTAAYFTPAMWYRVLLTRMCPDLDRVLYLDADTIAVDYLEPLWQTDIDGHYLAAVTNVFEPAYQGRPRQLGLAGPHVYFNTGVLLMNLSLMRRDRCAESLHRFAVEHAETLMWPDQDTFNVVLGSRRWPLHPRWNCMNSVMHMDESIAVFGAAAVDEARGHPAIRHFEGPAINKPWHARCRRATREVYFEHRRQTPWPRVRLEGAAMPTRARQLVREALVRR